MTSTQAAASPAHIDAVPGPSSLPADTHKHARQQQRRLQKQWITLLDQWTGIARQLSHTGYSQDPSLADSVETLIEQISHHAQQICRRITDRQWLVNAFQLAISTVLLDGADFSAMQPQGQGVPASLLIQLGQQLTQLAIHSVIQPLLDSLAKPPPPAPVQLKAWAAQQPQAAVLFRTLNECRHLSRRLSDVQLLLSASPDLETDSNLLQVCLEQRAPSILLWSARMPQSHKLISALIQHDSDLRQSARPYRLAIVADLLHAGRVDATTLEQSDLLVGWKDGRETGLWAVEAKDESLSAALAALADSQLPQPALLPSDSHVEPESLEVDAEKLLDFYINQATILESEFGLPELALDLCQAAERSVQASAKSSAGAALNRLHAEISTLCSLKQAGTASDLDTRGQLCSLEPVEVVLRLLRSTLSSVETERPTSATDAGSKAIEAVQVYLRTLPDSVDATGLLVSALQQLLGSAKSSSSGKERLLAVAVLKHLHEQTSDTLGLAVEQVIALLIAALYYRDGWMTNAIGLQTSAGIIAYVVDAVTAISSTSRAESDGALRGLRDAVLRDESTALGAQQIYATLVAAQSSSRPSLSATSRRLLWLADLCRVFPGSSAAARGLDLCWLLAFGGEDGSKQAQRMKLEALIEGCASIDTHVAPSSRAGRSDIAEMRKRAKWSEVVQTFPELVASNGPFAALSVPEAMEIALVGSIKTGDLELFRSLLMDSTVTADFSTAHIEHLILTVSTSLFDSASVASTRAGEMKTANDILDLVPPSTAVKLQRNFIEAACRLCSFRVRSTENPGQVMGAKEVRATRDRMTLISRLLAHKEDAYKSPELVLELALKLCAIGNDFPPCLHLVDPENSGRVRSEEDVQLGLTASQKTMVEIRTLAMLADTATAAGDFEEGSAFCVRLVEKIGVLRKRTQAQERNVPSAAGARTAAEGTAASILPEALELGWRTSYQLSKHPDWEDTPQRLTLLSHVLTLCPPDRLGAMLKAWRKVDEQLAEELKRGKVFASTRKGGWLGGVGEAATGVGVGGFAAGRDAANAAAAAASVGAGLVGLGANAAANLLPLSFSKLGYFGAGGAGAASGAGVSTTGVSASHQGKVATDLSAATAGGGSGISSRAAQLFDFDSGRSSPSGGGYLSLGGGGGTTEAAERAARAARAAARNFLGGWKASSPRLDGEADLRASSPSTMGRQGGTDQQERTVGSAQSHSGGFSFTRGVGWLIGEDQGGQK